MIVGYTDYRASINLLKAPYNLIGFPVRLPFIIFYQGFNLPQRWSRTANFTGYSYNLAAFNPAGTHLATIAYGDNSP